MKIIKTVSEEAAVSIRRGFIRIGSLLYYREMEDPIRVDKLEGIPSKVISGPSEISGEELNTLAESVASGFRVDKSLKLILEGAGELTLESDFNMHIFCCSIQNSTAKRNPKFGRCAFEIIDPKAFSSAICDALYVSYVSGRLSLPAKMHSVRGFGANVEYREKTRSSIVLENGERKLDLDAVYTKPRSFSDENEFRFSWIPVERAQERLCELPVRHKYVDLEVRGLSRHIRWIG